MIRFFNFLLLLKGNIIYSRSIGKQSDKLFDIVPTGKTFSIWSVIYYRLFRFSLSINTNEAINELYFKSNKLNVDWLKYIDESSLNKDQNFEKAFEIMIELKQTLKDILVIYKTEFEFKDLYVYEAFKLYYSWISVAFLIQEDSIKKKGNIKERLLGLITNETLSGEFINSGVILWAISGLYNKDTFEEYRGDILNSSKFNENEIDKIKNQTNIGSYINTKFIN
uniref:Uncharacterized protein n=1 Tax=viral metagenome TaxID=1070528 RepID=A0A6C0EIT5_9ZZZZ